MRRISGFSIAVALVLAGSMWLYVQRVLIPFQETYAAAHDAPRGNLSDLYPRWVGARELLLHGRDPYSADVTREIQAGYWGRPIDARRPGDPQDETRFAYPVYVVFLLAPTVYLPFSAVRILATWALGLCACASVLLWFRALRWRPSPTVLVVFLLLTLGSYPVVQGIKLQQLTLLVCALIAAGAGLLVRGKLVAAGAVLALATIKPQLVTLLLAWLLFWTFRRWRQRQKFFWSLAGTSVLLVGAGEYALPGWIGRFLHGLVEYQRYAGESSPLEILTTAGVGKLLSAILLLATVAVCWRLRRCAEDSAEFSLLLALVLTVTLAATPMMRSYNDVLLVPAVLLSVRSWSDLWSRNASRRLVCALAVLCVFWQWLASIALVGASSFLPAAMVQRVWAAPLWTIPAMSIALFGPLAFLVKDAMVLPQQKVA